MEKLERLCPICKCPMSVQIENGVQWLVCWADDVRIKREESKVGCVLCPVCGQVMHEKVGDDLKDYHKCSRCGHKQLILDKYLGMGHG